MRAALRLALALAFVPGPASAQILAGGAALERYTFADPERLGISAIEVRSVPVDASLPLGRLRLDVSGGFAQASLTNGLGIRTEMSGLAHTEVGLSLLLPGDAFLARVAAGLPSDVGEQSLTEAVIAGVMATELISFTLPYWGDGGSFGGDVGFATETRGVRLSVLGGYRIRKEHEILVGEEAVYHPGNQLRAAATLDAPLGMGILTLRGTAQKFGGDELENLNVYHAGRRMEGSASYTFPFGLTNSAVISVGLVDRAAGEASASGSAVFPLTAQPAYRVLWSGLDVRFPLGSANLLGEADLRSQKTSGAACAPVLSGRPSCPGTDGRVASVGLAAELPLTGSRGGTRLLLAPSAQMRFGVIGDGGGTAQGQVIEPGTQSSLTGWAVGVTLRVAGER
jgi:hypothetical protein